MKIQIKKIITENEFMDQALQNVRAGIGYDDRNGPVGNMTTEQFKPLATNELNLINNKILSGEIRNQQDLINQIENNSPVMGQGVASAKAYMVQNPNMTPNQIAEKLQDDQRLFDMAQSNNTALTRGMLQGGGIGIGAGIGAKALYDRFRKR